MLRSILFRAANAHDEVFEHERPFLCVVDFGVELHSPSLFAIDLVCRASNFVGRGDDAEIAGNGSDGVAVAHPHLRIVGQAGEQRVGFVDFGQSRPSVFSCAGRLDISATGIGDELRAVANAENRVFAAQFRQIDFKCFFRRKRKTDFRTR